MGYRRAHQRTGEALSNSREEAMNSRAHPKKGGRGSGIGGRVPGAIGSTEDAALENLMGSEEAVNLFSKRKGRFVLSLCPWDRVASPLRLGHPLREPEGRQICGAQPQPRASDWDAPVTVLLCRQSGRLAPPRMTALRASDSSAFSPAQAW